MRLRPRRRDRLESEGGVVKRETADAIWLGFTILVIAGVLWLISWAVWDLIS